MCDMCDVSYASLLTLMYRRLLSERALRRSAPVYSSLARPTAQLTKPSPGISERSPARWVSASLAASAATSVLTCTPAHQHIVWGLQVWHTCLLWQRNAEGCIQYTKPVPLPGHLASLGEGPEADSRKRLKAWQHP